MRPLYLTVAIATFEQTAYQYDGRETRIACLGIHREDRLTAFADPRDVASSGGAVTTDHNQQAHPRTRSVPR
jgi:hypothetical protein